VGLVKGVLMLALGAAAGAGAVLAFLAAAHKETGKLADDAAYRELFGEGPR
jgi:hypothetical protein